MQVFLPEIKAILSQTLCLGSFDYVRPHIFGCRFRADISPQIMFESKHYTVTNLTVLYCICLHLPSAEAPRRPAEVTGISQIPPKARGSAAEHRSHVVVCCALSSPQFDGSLCWSPMTFLQVSRWACTSVACTNYSHGSSPSAVFGFACFHFPFLSTIVSS